MPNLKSFLTVVLDKSTETTRQIIKHRFSRYNLTSCSGSLSGENEHGLVHSWHAAMKMAVQSISIISEFEKNSNIREDRAMFYVATNLLFDLWW